MPSTTAGFPPGSQALRCLLDQPLAILNCSRFTGRFRGRSGDFVGPISRSQVIVWKKFAKRTVSPCRLVVPSCWRTAAGRWTSGRRRVRLSSSRLLLAPHRNSCGQASDTCQNMRFSKTRKILRTHHLPEVGCRAPRPSGWLAADSAAAPATLVFTAGVFQRAAFATGEASLALAVDFLQNAVNLFA